MDRHEFVDAIDGQEMHMTRTCLATGRVEDNETLTPERPVHCKRTSSISLRSIHVYGDDDLFTHDYGVFVAVVKTGAGHLFVDRFEPVPWRQ